MHRSHLPLLTLPLALVLMAGGARASRSFPAVVQQHWALSKTPDCRICHSDDSGGTGTAVRWFGVAMQDFGLRKLDDASLESALDEDRLTDYDSDGDGITDFAELVSGTDPSDGPGPTVKHFTPPRHGCTAGSGAPGPFGAGAMMGFVVATGVYLRRRGARRSRSCTLAP